MKSAANIKTFLHTTAMLLLLLYTVSAAAEESSPRSEASRLVKKARALADFDYNRNYWISQDEFQQAIDLLVEASTKDPSYAPTYLALGNVYSGQAMLFAVGSANHNRLIDKALISYRKSSKLDGKNVVVLRKLARHLLIVYGRDSRYDKKEKDEIVLTYNRIIKLDPMQYRERYNYGLLLVRFGDTERGIDEMTEAIRHLPWRLTIDMKGDLTDILISLERYLEAIEVLQINGADPWQEKIKALKREINPSGEKERKQ
jgi:tetratricopeptide (TPR) repeat protein